MDEDDPCQILPRLYLGNAKHARDLPLLETYQITYVLNMKPDGEHEVPSVDFYARHKHPIILKHVLAHDLHDYDISKHFDESFDFIEDGLSKGNTVFVHCGSGVSRSPTIVCSYLMKKYGIGAEKALREVHSKRNCVCPNMGFMKRLFLLEESLKSNSESDNGGGYS